MPGIGTVYIHRTCKEVMMWKVYLDLSGVDLASLGESPVACLDFADGYIVLERCSGASSIGLECNPSIQQEDFGQTLLGCEPVSDVSI